MAQQDDGNVKDAMAELRGYVLENPRATVMSLVERFNLSQRRVAACLADLEATGQLVRDAVVRTDGWSYPVHSRSDRGLRLVRQGVARKRAYVDARTKALAVEELALVLPPGAAALPEKRVVPHRADSIVTGRVVVSACWLLGLLDASAGRVVARGRRRVLVLGAEARAETRRVELCCVDGKLVDTRVAVDAAWLAELVGRNRRGHDELDAAELVLRLSKSARATVAARDLSSVATGVGARVEVDAAWLHGVIASRPARTVSRQQ